MGGALPTQLQSTTTQSFAHFTDATVIVCSLHRRHACALLPSSTPLLAAPPPLLAGNIFSAASVCFSEDNVEVALLAADPPLDKVDGVRAHRGEEGVLGLAVLQRLDSQRERFVQAGDLREGRSRRRDVSHDGAERVFERDKYVVDGGLGGRGTVVGSIVGLVDADGVLQLVRWQRGKVWDNGLRNVRERNEVAIVEEL